MGLLYGEKLQPNEYKDTKQYQEIIKENAILQIIKNLKKFGN